MQKVTAQKTNRRLTNVAVPTSLVIQADKLKASAMDEFGLPRFHSRNEIAEAGLRLLLIKEKERSA